MIEAQIGKRGTGRLRTKSIRTEYDRITTTIKREWLAEIIAIGNTNCTSNGYLDSSTGTRSGGCQDAEHSPLCTATPTFQQTRHSPACPQTSVCGQPRIHVRDRVDSGGCKSCRDEDFGQIFAAVGLSPQEVAHYRGSRWFILRFTAPTKVN